MLASAQPSFYDKDFGNELARIAANYFIKKATTDYADNTDKIQQRINTNFYEFF